MLRTVKIVIDTKSRMLKLMPDKKDLQWTFKYLCNSDYIGDKDTRLSVTGYYSYINKCLISWKSRAYRCIMLLSTEAEYMALSEICSDILFIKQVLEFLGEENNYPIMVYCNNAGEDLLGI